MIIVATGILFVGLAVVLFLVITEPYDRRDE
jgi:hypothetical protein